MTEQTIERRLKALPNRISVPFKRLLEAKQIDNETLTVVLDASELAGGDTNQALGFAIGYQYLASHGVPVRDVIIMAKQQQRAIRLNWSAKRWQEEHDRLARAETLKRMAEENVTYDLSEYAALLPTRFEGYLIRSSLRLGMEGLRQRHCVAAYHTGVAVGRYAFVAVFIDSKRWTVQICLKPSETGTILYMVSARSRFNEPPSRTVVKRIHDMLGLTAIESTQRSTVADRPPQERHYLRSLQSVLPVLQAHAIHSVYVSFDGSGDSGAVDDIQYLRMRDGQVTTIASNDNAFNGGDITVDLTVSRIAFNHETGTWDCVVTGDTVSLDAAITALVEDYLESTDVDWYNNDGGYGELNIDVNDETVELEVRTRFTDSDLAFAQTLNIHTGLTP